jgi:hypothetical protein
MEDTVPNKYKPVRPIIFVIGPSISYVELTNDRFALIDLEDAEEVGRFNWAATSPGKGRMPYATRYRRINEEGGMGRVAMQTCILKPHPWLVADHINGNTLDNRKSANLRAVNRFQNAQNSKLFCNNKSGYRGVSWYPSRAVWVVRITRRGVSRFVGYFKELEDAASAAELEATDRHGSFRRRP